MIANENELINRLMAKDEQALTALVAMYDSRVRAVVRRFIRDEWDVDEVVQDTFWTVYRKIHLFRGDAQLWTWMYRVAVNAAKMRLRKGKRVPVPIDDDALRSLQHEESMAHVSDRPDRLLARRQMLAELEQFLNDCDDTGRDIYVSMELDGASKEEIAERLNLTVPAVKTRLHRLRSGLRERLEPFSDAA